MNDKANTYHHHNPVPISKVKLVNILNEKNQDDEDDVSDEVTRDESIHWECEMKTETF